MKNYDWKIFDVDLKQTRVYQDAKEEGRLEGLAEVRAENRLKIRLELVPRCLEFGFSIAETADFLKLSIEQVEAELFKHQSDSL
jgi:predicted transposase YdaD